MTQTTEILAKIELIWRFQFLHAESVLGGA